MRILTMNYNFDINIAKEYGVNEAIMINNFVFWIAKNKANGKNQHDGHSWTFNSKRAYKILFPFWSDSQIKTILNNLIKKEVLIKGNYNKIAYDRTLWYAFKSENKFLSNDNNDQPISQESPMGEPVVTNGKAKDSQPIPYKNTDKNTDIKHIYNFWQNQKIKVHKSMTSPFVSAIKRALKDYSVKDIEVSIINYKNILVSELHYFTYRWSIDAFLKKGLSQFDDEVCYNNFLKGGQTTNYKSDALAKSLLQHGIPQQHMSKALEIASRKMPDMKPSDVKDWIGIIKLDLKESK